MGEVRHLAGGCWGREGRRGGELDWYPETPVCYHCVLRLAPDTGIVLMG